MKTCCDLSLGSEELPLGKHIGSFGYQGNLIGRGIIEFCDGAPRDKNFISLGGPHAGTASIPLCGVCADHVLPFMKGNLARLRYEDYR
ncbi:hypothetical protein JHK82_055217 [Glycine max]|nr:hypothetical protein JHK82_055217 [Glycine max]